MNQVIFKEMLSALQEARRVLVLCTLIDKSNQCNEAIEVIESAIKRSTDMINIEDVPQFNKDFEALSKKYDYERSRKDQLKKEVTLLRQKVYDQLVSIQEWKNLAMKLKLENDEYMNNLPKDMDEYDRVVNENEDLKKQIDILSLKNRQYIFQLTSNGLNQ